MPPVPLLLLAALLAVALPSAHALRPSGATNYFPTPSICAQYKGKQPPPGLPPTTVTNISTDAAQMFNAFMSIAVAAPPLPSVLGPIAQQFESSRQDAASFPAVLSRQLSYAQSVLQWNATFNAFYFTASNIASSYAKDNSSANFKKLNATWTAAVLALNQSITAVNASSNAVIGAWNDFRSNSNVSCANGYLALCPGGVNSTLQVELKLLNATKGDLAACGSNSSCVAYYTKQLQATEASIATAEAQLAACANTSAEMRAWAVLAPIIFLEYSEAFDAVVEFVLDAVLNAAGITSISPFTEAFLIPLEYQADAATLEGNFVFMLQLLTTACTNLYA